ncbi:MAG: ABC transporter transmembrane domain-containing protein, partial [Hyphomicrobiales bacterium]
MQEGQKPPVDKTGETVDALQDKLKGAFCPSSTTPPADPAPDADASSSWIKAWQLVSAARNRVSAPPEGDEPQETADTPVPQKLDTAPAWYDRLVGGDGAFNEFAAAPKLPKSVYISSLFINLLGLALPLVILQVYDRILPNEATATLSMLILGLVCVIVIDTTMKIARAYMVGWVTAHHEFAVATEAITRLLNAPSSRIEGEPSSVHIDRLNAIDAMRDFYGGQSRLLLLDLPFIVIFLGLMAFIGGYLVFVPIALFFVLGSLSVSRGMALRKVLQTRAQHDDRRYDFIIQSLIGIQTIKIMAMEPQIQRRFERLQKIGATASHDTILLGNSAQIVGNLFSNLAMISVVTVGAYLVVNGSLTMGALAACT